MRGDFSLAPCDVYRQRGELRIDEAIVEQHVAHTLADAQQTAEVMRQMLRLRDPKGIYEAGGCIDTTREAPRKVGPCTTTIVLPVD